MTNVRLSLRPPQGFGNYPVPAVQKNFAPGQISPYRTMMIPAKTGKGPSNVQNSAPVKIRRIASGKI